MSAVFQAVICTGTKDLTEAFKNLSTNFNKKKNFFVSQFARETEKKRA